MATTVARASFVIALATALAGCGSCTKTEAHANVPVKLDDVKKLAKPPRVVVRVERKEETGGGAACTEAEVEAAYFGAKKLSDASRGTLCTKP